MPTRPTVDVQMHGKWPPLPSCDAPDAKQPAALPEAIQHAAHLLPAQGPITTFVHHNTLHALEHLPFDAAVEKGARIFGCHPYLSEDHYRRLLEHDRIRGEDLRVVLLEDLGDQADGFVGPLGTRYHLRLAMLEHPLRQAPTAELRWLVAETEALRRFRSETPPACRKRMIDATRHWVMRDLRNESLVSSGDRRAHEIVAGLLDRLGASTIENWSESRWEAVCLQLLWRICHQGVHGVRSHAAAPPAPVRHRDLLLQATGEDSDLLVHPILIRFCGAFLDQGFANWSLPRRARGFYHAFVSLYEQAAGPPDRWLRGLATELRRLAEGGVGPRASLEASLAVLGVDGAQRDRFLAETLLALRGWAGMIWQLETRGDRAIHPVPRGTLVGYLAIRLLLERLALAYLAEQSLGFRGPLRDLRKEVASRLPKAETISVDQRAFVVFQLAQVLEWKPRDLYQLSKGQWVHLLQEIEAFAGLQRRRVFHEAYERRYRLQALDAVARHARRAARRSEAPRYQVICCIDEREESFRRHLEEIAPECETFGAAGFFGVAMYYRGVADAHYTPLCPAIMRPKHYVREHVMYPFEKAHRRRLWTRRVIGAASHQVHRGSRTFAGGAFLTALLGPLASIPLVARVLVPRLTAQVRRLMGRFVQPPPMTQLQLERIHSEPGPQAGHIGFTVDEMAKIVERLLRDLGLTSDIAPLVFVVGHGSSSLNNPHEAAHDCGACGGARGGPNARAYAQMANDPRVRDMMAQNGLVIPARTHFVGAYHNTCDDSVSYFDLDRLPVAHRELFERARQDINQSRQRNAHERCRRFESAPLMLTTEAALEHVEGRAEDLAQTRPEYGHATNSLCFVGRRWKSRGLFLDRRAFLASYDPTQDNAEHAILTRILQAVIPVCAGINLEYYFSFVDPTGWGCGTKLPHNVASLLGVMDGAASDLRTGLPWQMVEIHEPMRLLFVVETTPQAMLDIMDRDKAIGMLCRNHWVQLATQDPETSGMHLFRHGRFEPYRPESSELPVVATSLDWYRGWRDHLGFAAVSTGQTRSDGRSQPFQQGAADR